MKIALIGYGKMGKAIEQIAINNGDKVVAKINHKSELEKAIGADVCIEFTQPDAALENLLFCAKNNLPVVCGTTAWYDGYEEVKQAFEVNNGALLTATNFSIGVNIFFKINRELSKIMSKFPTYKVSMEETHHLQKLDHPSGTATTLAEDIIANTEGLNTFDAFAEGDKEPPQSSSSFGILCKRAPEVPGTHSVKYHSAIDDIFIEHKAHNRTGFATGAVTAAHWLRDKTGVFTMRDVLGL